MFLRPCRTHPARLAVGQELVFLLGVEDQRVWREGNGLALEGGAFVRADEQHLVPLVYGRTHQHHLKEEEETKVRGKKKKKSKCHVPHPIHSSVNGPNKTFLLISLHVHINFPVFSGKLMNINARTFI